MSSNHIEHMERLHDDNPWGHGNIGNIAQDSKGVVFDGPCNGQSSNQTSMQSIPGYWYPGFRGSPADLAWTLDEMCKVL